MKFEIEAKCDKKLIEAVRPLVEAGNSWPTIAKSVGASETSLRNYRTKGKPSFNKAFAAMAVKAREEFDTGKIKAGQVKQAQKHILKKVIKELQNLGPRMPKASYTKSVIIQYAKDVLKLKLNMKMKKAEMLYACERKVEKLEDWQMVQVREEITDVDPSQPAVKNALLNMGKVKWDFTEKVDLGINLNAMKDEECEEVRNILKKNVR